MIQLNGTENKVSDDTENGALRLEETKLTENEPSVRRDKIINSKIVGTHECMDLPRSK